MNENMSMELSASIKGHFDWSSSFSPAPVNGHVHLFLVNVKQVRETFQPASFQ